MIPFVYSRATTMDAVVRSSAQHGSAENDGTFTDLFAGGTDMMQLMNEHARNPKTIIDITQLPGMSSIEVTASGLRLGALVKMSACASHEAIVLDYPVLSQALLLSASQQVRNLASLGGNLLQRTRCGYFRDVVSPCNKRQPGSGCPALNGQNRLLAILGTSDSCIATYAGDFANALLALDASIHISGATGARTVSIADLHHAPANTPHIETSLIPGDVITHIDIPRAAMAQRSYYLKVRDRTSFAFALASAAVAIDMAEDGTVTDLRVAVGGVATTPWRLRHVEDRLRGQRLTQKALTEACEFAAEGSVSHGRNGFKKQLLPRVVERALLDVGAVKA